MLKSPPVWINSSKINRRDIQFNQSSTTSQKERLVEERVWSDFEFGMEGFSVSEFAKESDLRQPSSPPQPSSSYNNPNPKDYLQENSILASEIHVIVVILIVVVV